jgi:hypothetical protein
MQLETTDKYLTASITVSVSKYFKHGGVISVMTVSSSDIFFFNLCGGTFGTAATTGLLYQPRMIGDSDCGEIDGI